MPADEKEVEAISADLERCAAAVARREAELEGVNSWIELRRMRRELVSRRAALVERFERLRRAEGEAVR